MAYFCISRKTKSCHCCHFSNNICLLLFSKLVDSAFINADFQIWKKSLGNIKIPRDLSYSYSTRHRNVPVIGIVERLYNGGNVAVFCAFFNNVANVVRTLKGLTVSTEL